MVIWVESRIEGLLILIGFLSFIEDELAHVLEIAILDIMKVIFTKKKWAPLQLVIVTKWDWFSKSKILSPEESKQVKIHKPTEMLNHITFYTLI